LAAKDRVKADLVKLRYFGGLTTEEAAGILGISTATADRHGPTRAWLQTEITTALQSWCFCPNRGAQDPVAPFGEEFTKSQPP
jgi:hypothetical protein